MSAHIAKRLMTAGMSEAAAKQKMEVFPRIESQLACSREEDLLRWFVPGRIEVLGKHTDYAGGRSLLCTAERGFCVAVTPRSDAWVRVYDLVRRSSAEFELSPDLIIPDLGWRLYVHVVARRVARNFPGPLRGVDLCLASDLPSAAGMSSSSALVVAVFAVLSAVNDLPARDEYRANIQSQTDLASYLGCIENGQNYRSLVGDGGVGTFGGSEDHTAILTSNAGHLKQFSFCPVRHERTVRLPDGCAFVIGVSGVVADKTGSAKASYNHASQSAREVLQRWRSASGSDAATLAEAATSAADSAERIRTMLRRTGETDSHALINRFEQFLLESESIIPQATDALARGDLSAFGKLVDESQAAAENLLGNQVAETIFLARTARQLGAYAASAFGAGFGGSVWALTAAADAPEFAEKWRKAYEASGHQAAAKSLFFITAAGPPMVRL